MRLARLGIRAWDLPLVRPLRVGGHWLERRTGLLVVVDDGEGHAGVGETAPLPGLNRESIAEAATQLLALAEELEGTTVPDNCPALGGAFESWLGGHGLHSSVRTGVEGAVLMLLADRAGTDLAHLLARDPDGRVRINGLLDGDAGVVLDEAERFAGQGYAALKIKVGRRDPTAEADLVNAVRDRVGSAVALRLDANRAWDLPMALAFVGLVERAQVAYIEEPVRDPADLPAFIDRAGIPVALDETLLDYSPAAPPALRGVAALVLKIPVIGGFERAMAWARLARHEHIAAVVSAAFPSAVGLALEAGFAASLGRGGIHGLGTSAAFSEDLGRAPLPCSDGRIDATRLPRRMRDFSLEHFRVLR